MTHPLLAPWTGPFGGVPSFDSLDVGALRDALREAMGAWRAEIAAIVSSPEAPSFENTVAALEDSGRALDRVSALYFVAGSVRTTPEHQALELEIEPELAALGDELLQNKALFARVDAVHAAREALPAEARRVVEQSWKGFVRGGARLDAAAGARLAAINQALATANARFAQNVLADEQTFTAFASASDLDGLPADFLGAAAVAAEARGLPGQWVVLNTRSMVDPFLTFGRSRSARERVWRAFVSRGDRGGETDNNALIVEILRLRAERARLLGAPTHAHWRLSDSMAGSPARAEALLRSVWTPAVARAREEVAAQQALADAEGADFRIAPWDFRFYQEKVRKQRFDLDQAEVKPYLQLDKLREAMFWCASELFGLRFVAVEGLSVPHDDVRVWEVQRPDGAHLGLFYFDPYARPGKQSGAWMSAWRKQERFRSPVTTIVSNNCNFARPPAGQAALISWDDARTLFHEFGHGLHGLLSDVTYPSLSGTSVDRDFVEFPSQLFEHWLMAPEVLARFAVHVDTGAPMPAELVAKIKAASTFNQGFATVEYLGSAFVDLLYHTAAEPPSDPRAFEAGVLAGLGMPEEVGMRHRSAHFAHIFTGDHYAAGYYSYLWADTLVADAAEAFKASGSMFTPSLAIKLRDGVLSVGNTREAAEVFRGFRGRDVDPGALMRERGFPVAG
jgi:peptidyl-dipeptidase Dcp